MKNKYFLKDKFSYNGYDLFNYLAIIDIRLFEDIDYLDVNFQNYRNYHKTTIYSNNSNRVEYKPTNRFYFTNNYDEFFRCKITTDFIENLPTFHDKRVVFYKKEIVKKIVSNEKYKHLIPSWMKKGRKLSCIKDFELQNCCLPNDKFKYITIKEAMFLELDKLSGCYIIKNTENNKYYVGQSTNLSKRLRNHFDFNKPRNPIFLDDYYKSSLKDKEEIFKISFIFENDWNKINELEKILIKKFSSCNFGYNSSEGGGTNFSEKTSSQKESQFIKKLQIIKNEILKLNYGEEVAKKNGVDRDTLLKQMPEELKEIMSKRIKPVSEKRNELYNKLLDEIIKSNLLD